MFLGVQLVVMALLSREGYHKRVSYFIRIFRKLDTASGTSGASSPHASNHTGGDVYANLSLLAKAHGRGEDMPYCPKTSPLIGEFTHRNRSPRTGSPIIFLSSPAAVFSYPALPVPLTSFPLQTETEEGMFFTMYARKILSRKKKVAQILD